MRRNELLRTGLSMWRSEGEQCPSLRSSRTSFFAHVDKVLAILISLYAITNEFRTRAGYVTRPLMLLQKVYGRDLPTQTQCLNTKYVILLCIRVFQLARSQATPSSYSAVAEVMLLVHKIC
jgi:hypothetical protein